VLRCDNGVDVQTGNRRDALWVGRHALERAHFEVDVRGHPRSRFFQKSLDVRSDQCGHDLVDCCALLTAANAGCASSGFGRRRHR